MAKEQKVVILCYKNITTHAEKKKIETKIKIV